MSELTKLVCGGFTEDCDYTGDPEFVQMLCAEHERLEAVIAGTGDTAILTVNILRLWSAEQREAFARHLLGSEWKSPEHERLQTDLDMMGDYVDYLQADLVTLEAEHARICNEHALLVQESGREGRELDRLEGLLRAWAVANMVSNEDRNSETLTAALAAFQNAYAEAVRLAKEKP